RKPDVSVVLCDPWQFVAPSPHCREVPALVVEVISSSNQFSEILAKIDMFLGAGTRLAWIVDPVTRSVHVYRADGTVTRLREPAELTGESVLPGFSVALSAFLPRIIPA
ncbi:MAG: Uma2 family endonuclease, partial [Gemmataceae bacterium]